MLSVLGISVFLFACTKRESIVTVNDWWSVDFAKNGCELGVANGNPYCAGLDPAAEVRNFEQEMSTFFATDSSCHGVVLATYSGPVEGRSSNAASKSAWTLMMNFTVGQTSQYWSMTRHTGDNSYTTGHGNPKEMAHSICAVVNHIGGSIQ
jgi:hypothetical protein